MERHTTNRSNFRQSQRGAALVVGLVLLVALTLLALSSMNTASLDLVMAGNEQYHNNAFNAAEAGLQQAENQMLQFTTNAVFSSSGSTATGDSYSYTVTAFDKLYDALDGNSKGTYKSLYFDVVASGTSTRGAAATHMQTIRMPVYDPNTIGGCGAACGDSVTLDP